ncbi:MAG: sugar phosphate isomerase/epimerase [Methylacidiphilales bacterium]|nr:sugar phosphate isomerase/epimerase [Candidatus Methylacidiphilales bacterium]
MPQLIPGLVSVTFRSLPPEEIINLTVKAGLKTIEWGGDIHVPPGDGARAREVGRQTREAGMSVAAYGSYYRVGFSETNGLPFAQVLDTAVTLGAPTIRVWAGQKGSHDTPPQERSAVIADALRIADLSRAHGVTISFEYHDGTLTDTRDSVQRLLEEMAHPNLEFLWQPKHGETVEQGVARLRDVCPRLRHVHVFHWWPTASDRRPLIEGRERWGYYLEILQGMGKTVPCLLEFVRDDSTEQFLQDAATLRDWLGKSVQL